MSDNAQALIDYVIALADDSLVLGQRLAEWCYHAPFLEEDLAMSNVALDYIGRAQMFYEYAAELMGEDTRADDLAFMRDAREYSNLLINELPNGDFAFTMVRQLMLDIFQVTYLTELSKSSNETLAAIAARTLKESSYHLRRSRVWALRLGDGTEESHQRMQSALVDLWGYVPEVFQMTGAETALLESGVSVDRVALKAAWDTELNAVLAEATLERPADEWQVTGGRDGVHTEHLGFLLAEMQSIPRAMPGLEW